jgi:large subunit ribosomal protein L23
MDKALFDVGNLFNLIKYPSITEKSVNLYNFRQYTFIVDRHLTKTQIKFILEKAFDVRISAVNTCLLPLKEKRVGKFTGKKSRYKKAFVTLKEGETISQFSY